MRLDPIFCNGMVLQANKEIRLFGTGGGTIEVQLLGYQVTQTVVATRWELTLPAQDYGGPYNMTVTLDGRTRTISDIWFGDVYLLTGQSNMQFKLQESDYPVTEYRTHPNMRLFSCERMEEGEYFFPEDGWVKCTKEEAGKWPCIGYITGDFLLQKSEHAIGLIACYQGAAAIQSLMPDESFVNKRFFVPEEERFDIDFPWNKGNSILYKYMVEPLMPLSMAAVLFYQGESNNSDKESRLYYDMLVSLIESWRKGFRDNDLKFIIMQIADNDNRQSPVWERIQHAQAIIGESTPNVFTVISKDVCESDKIHPLKKTELSRRIADLL